MEFIVVIDVDSAIGMFLLTSRGKIGGATDLMALPNKGHPYVIARDLDWSKLPAFVGMTHLRNPGADDPMARELVVPASAVLAVVPMEKTAGQPQAAQQQPSGALH